MENRDSNRRRFIRRVAGFVAALGIVGLASGKAGVPTVEAADDGSLLIGNANLGTNMTTLTSGANHNFVGYNSGSGTGLVGHSETGAGIWAETGSAGTIGLKAIAGGSNTIPIVAKGYSSQNTNLQEWRNSSEGVLSVITKDGKLGIGTADPDSDIHAYSTAHWPGLKLQGMDPDTGVDGFRIQASHIQYNVGVGGLNHITLSNKFFIHDLTNGMTRLVIASNGSVGIGTTSPTSKLHVNGRVKAQGYDTGDITYANGMKTTEEGSGLAFLNDAGEKIAILDRQGNFHIKGRYLQDL